MTMGSRMFIDIGKAYNLVDDGTLTDASGQAHGVEWKVSRVSGTIRIEIKKVREN